MSLSYNKSGLKIEHVIIAILAAALIGALVYFMAFRDATPVQVAAPAAIETPVATPAPSEAAATATQEQPVGFGMAVGEFKGELHPIVSILDGLKGFKYDQSVAAADTVYIVYDPRCPYCHNLFDKISAVDLKAKKITIKWLPSLALGTDDNAEKLAALSLRAKTIEDFGASFQPNADVSGVTITQDDKDALNENMAFLFEASDQTFGADHPKSVPATFFIDKTTGAPNMMYGASDDAIFKQIFGE